jgi:hypothetical protein
MKNKEENPGDEEMPYQCNFVLIPRREKTDAAEENLPFKSGEKFLYLESKNQR